MMLIHRGHVSRKNVLNRRATAISALKPIANFGCRIAGWEPPEPRDRIFDDPVDMAGLTA